MTGATRQVVFVAATRSETHVIASLDAGYASRQGGYGGWEDVQRPGQVPATNYVGPSSGGELAIPIILGEWKAGHNRSIEGDIEKLKRLAGKPAGAPRRRRPPPLKITGPVDHEGALWVIEDLQWGTGRSDVVRLGANRVRARLTVVLKRYVPVDLVEIEPSRQRKQNATRTYKVKDGEGGRHGLALIVARELNARGSREINAQKRRVLKLNGLRDGQQVRAGMKLRLPR